MKIYRISLYSVKSKIYDFIENYEGHGFHGYCGKFAIDLNKVLGDIGEYFAAINVPISKLDGHWFGHVALKVDDVLYDIDGEINDIEKFRAWGMVDPYGSQADLYNLSEEECYEAEVVNLSKILGTNAETVILETFKT